VRTKSTAIDGEGIGWDAVTHSQRLKLVVQLRRFLVLETTRIASIAAITPVTAGLPFTPNAVAVRRDRRLKNALLAIIPFDADQTLSSWFEIYQRQPATAIQLILHAAPVQ
jgi:hypothetical protein